MTKDNIQRTLNNARSTFQYARFDMGTGDYITINYSKDQKIEIMTNSRNIALWNQIEIMRRSYTQMRLVDFVFRWINTLNR